MKKKLFVVLPAFNEEKTIGKVLTRLKKILQSIKGIDHQIIVIDDASWDKTGQIGQDKGALLLRHVINRGLGGALRTGFEYARLQGADFLVTMDSDGQHDPKDIKRVLKPILENRANFVIGKRDIGKMPVDRKIITILSSLLTFFLFGIWCSDTQSGFRGFGKKAIDKIEIKTQRMEVSSEFFNEIMKHKLRFTEVPINVIYTPYSRLKGQSNLNAIKILLRLLLRLAR